MTAEVGLIQGSHIRIGKALTTALTLPNPPLSVGLSGFGSLLSCALADTSRTALIAAVWKGCTPRKERKHQ